MPTTLTIAGLQELRLQLRNLPKHLAQEAQGIVTSHAEAAADKIRNAYPIVTGNLKKGVKVDRVTKSEAGAAARVRSTSRHSHLFEYGTQARHTKIGANRGAMPAKPTFIPIVTRERREMVEDLIGLVQSEGLTVTGRG